MACNECNQNTTPCDEATNPGCSCPLKVGTICVVYDGDELFNINVQQGDNMTDILVKIDALFQQITGTGFLVNIGTGQGVYKQQNLQGLSELKSILSSDGSVTITSTDNEINLAVPIIDPSNFGEVNTASNIGTGLNVFSQKVAEDLQFKTILAGTGVNINNSLGGNELVISATPTTPVTYTGSNLGAGEEVFKQISSNDFEFRTITGGNGITATTLGDEITLAIAPTQAPTEQIERTTSFSLDNTMNEQVVYLDNGASNINVTVPNTLANNFKCGFIQLGTGDVTFVASSTTLNNANGLVIAGQYNQAFVQKRNAGTNQFVVLGNLTT